MINSALVELSEVSKVFTWSGEVVASKTCQERLPSIRRQLCHKPNELKFKSNLKRRLYLIRDSEVLDGRASDVNFRHPPEPIAVSGRADDLPQVDVHPVVARHQVAVVRFAVLQLHQHRVVLGSAQQRQRKHFQALH